MSSLDATFNIFPVTSHVTADDVVFHCGLMSVSVVLDFFFWAEFVVLGCLFYSVWFALFCNKFISLLSRSLGRALSSLFVRRVCKIAIIDY